MHIFRCLLTLSVLLPQSIVAITSSITPAYLFAHGLRGTNQQKELYVNNNIISAKHPSYSSDGPEVTSEVAAITNDNVEVRVIDDSKVVFGQEDDIAIIEKTAQQILVDQQVSAIPIIGVGHSKGGSTLINAAVHAPTFAKNLALLILDSVFAHIGGVSYHVGKQFGIHFLPGGVWLAHTIMEMQFPRYNPDGIHPMASILSVPNCPIIFIHSKHDKVVPINHPRKLYRELIKMKRNNVYLVELASGDHEALLSTNNPERMTFIKAVHAVCQTYNLPYDPELAKDVDLKNYQPSLEEIEERIDIDEPGIFLYNGVKSLVSLFDC